MLIGRGARCDSADDWDFRHSASSPIPNRIAGEINGLLGDMQFGAL